LHSRTRGQTIFRSDLDAPFPVLYDEKMLPAIRCVVYGLVDRGDPDRVRYVGKTNTPALRYLTHLASRREWEKEVRAKWIHDCCLQDRQPIMVLLEEVEDPDQLSKREVYWIKKLRQIGQADFNVIATRLANR
jgi:hypothetical protein